MSTKEEFIELLRSTNREGVEDLLEDLENMGLYGIVDSPFVFFFMNTGRISFTMEIEKKWTQPIHSWGLIMNQFMLIFENRIQI